MLSKEQWIGLVFLGGIGLLSLFTIMLRDVNILPKKTYDLHVHFSNVHGLDKGDQVRLGGMRIGEVSALSVKPAEGYIDVTMSIEPMYKISNKSSVTVAMDGMLGGHFVDVELAAGKTFYTTADLIKGTPSTDIGEMVRRAGESLEKLNKIADDVAVITANIKAGKGTIGKLLTDEAVFNGLKDMGKNVAKLADNLNEVVVENKTNVKNIVEDLSKTVPEIRKTFKKISSVKTFLGVDYKTNREEEKSYSMAYLRIEPSPDKFYQLGVSGISSTKIDAFESARGRDDEDFKPRVTLQLGRRSVMPFGGLMTYSAGLLEGRTGGRVGFGRLDDRIRLTVEGRDVWDNEEYDKGLVRSYLSVRPFSSLKGLRMHVGGENLVSNASMMFGINYEYSDEDLKYLVGLMGAR